MAGRIISPSIGPKRDVETGRQFKPPSMSARRPFGRSTAIRRGMRMARNPRRKLA